MPAQPDMPAASDCQAAFARALLHAAPAAPGAIASTRPPGPARRFGVHRNNVRASLVAALAARYPVVRRLVGADFFEAMGVVFIARHPPGSPVLTEYGDHLPAFLAAFEPAAGLPYLPDVARLEWARHCAFHAADAEPIAIERLAALPAESLGSVQLALHPALRLVASPWPILSVWTANREDEVRPLAPDAAAESVLVTRPALQVLTQRLPAGGDILLAAILHGASLGDAVTEAMEAVPSFDTAATLALIFSAGAVAGLNEGPPI